jgi:tRNA (mo5U34)-methyltransferase
MTVLPPDPLEEAVVRLGPWFHNLHLPGGLQTRPDHPLGDFPRFKWEEIGAVLPQDLTGLRALDLGCNAGYYSFELARRGAEVVALDLDPHYLRQARWAADVMGLADRIHFVRRSVYGLDELDGTFDVVLFLGVFYHLRHPLLGLDVVSRRVSRNGVLVFQTLTMPGEEVAEPPDDVDLDGREVLLEPGWPRMAFVERRLAGDPTNWWAPSHAACEAMLRSAGMEVVDRPGHEIYVCRRRDDVDPVIESLVEHELRQVRGEGP